MPRVAFFSNQFASGQGHGIARYAHELYAALMALGGHEVTPVAAWSSKTDDELAQLRRRTGLRLTGLGRRITPLAWTFLDWPPLDALLPGSVDLVHAVSLGYPVATRKPYVVTVHDLGHLTHPEYFGGDRPWVMQKALRHAERQADVLICVSRFTASEVIDYLGPAIEPRLRVIYEGVSPSFFDPPDMGCLLGLGLPPIDVPLILSAGKISPRKNIQGVLEAMSALIEEIPHHLVLVGGAGWDTEEVFATLKNPVLRDRVHLLGYVSDTQLHALYARASVYVHPSLYEGFGLTVLEAMASGTPVITANMTSLPEVAGDAALLIDPRDTSMLSGAIAQVCHDPELAHRLSRSGKEQARGFDWVECARAVAAVYDEVTG